MFFIFWKYYKLSFPQIGIAPHENEYPLPISCAVVSITPTTKGNDSNTFEGKLDLRRAVATATNREGFTTEVRVLSDRNVLLINSKYDVSINQVTVSYFGAAKEGSTDGVSWIHQVMPGDPDYKGMEFAVALATKDNLKAIAVVTSWESGEVLTEAIKQAKEALIPEEAVLIREHEARWNKFWSASGVQMDDRDLQNWWYRCLYNMSCFCKPGTIAIGLHAGLATESVGWHSSYKLNYNTQQTYWPQFVCNHVNDVDPFVQLLKGHLSRAKWLARFAYDCDGAYYFSDLFPFEPHDPDSSKSKRYRQTSYIPWGYTLGMTSWAAYHAWLCYKYQPDREYLENEIYPILKETSTFFLDFMSKCRKDADQKVILGPSFSPEHGPFGTDNNPFDIAFTLNLFEAMIEASSVLGRDTDLAGRCRKAIQELPDYPTAIHANGNRVVVDWEGCKPDEVKIHNITVPTVPIFPADRITWFSPEAQKKLFKQTIQVTRHNDNNSHVMMNVARARFSMPEAIDKAKEWYASRELPNGLFHENWGYNASESWAVAGLISEFLFQSAGDILRIFPCWPEDKDASFTNLRAQGGFLVTAEQREGKITRLEITSTVGGGLRMLSPWKSIKVRTKSGETILKADSQGVVEVETNVGEKLVFFTEYGPLADI